MGRNYTVYLLFRWFCFFLRVQAIVFIVQLKIQHYWIVIPILFYLVLVFVGKFIKRINVITITLEVASLLSIVLLFFSIKIKSVSTWLQIQFEIVAFIIISSFFISLAVSKFITKENHIEQLNSDSGQLLNLFYLNTSKAHEIAMLIDNKIMKTIEREQVSEELLVILSLLVKRIHFHLKWDIQ